MNLISCEDCGVVLDKDKLNFPEEIRDEQDEVIEDNAVWDGYDYASCVPCPVCKSKIPEKEGR